jgi:hypothetical protein
LQQFQDLQLLHLTQQPQRQHLQQVLLRQQQRLQIVPHRQQQVPPLP